MNARRDSSDEPEAGSSAGRVLLAGAVLLALAATGLLVLTDEQKWLRLGIVAALWAALGGSFVAARYRRQVADQREAAAERQRIYELELEREIAARREYELEVAAEAKRQAEEESRDDIAVLRDELQKMRQTLESLLGGEFLVERYALRAESTRMRSIGDDRSIAVNGDVKRLPAARSEQPDVVVPPVVREAETEMIERIREVHHKPRREPAPLRPEPKVPESRPPSASRRPARPDRPTPEPVKPPKRPEPAQPAMRPEPAQRPDPVAPVKRPEPVAPVKRPEPVVPAAARQQEMPTRFVEHPAEVSDRWFVPDGLGDSGQMPVPVPPARKQRRPEQPRRPEPKRPVDQPPPRTPPPSWDDSKPEWAPSWEQAQNGAPAGNGMPVGNGAPIGMTAEQTSWLAQYNSPQPAAGSTYSSRAYVPPVRPEPESAPEPALNDRPSRRGAEYRAEEPPAGRRHRAEAVEESGGGRRRRAEGQPSWQETVGEPSGSHAAGRSVSELLANHGHDTSPRRRRRRED